VKRTFSEVNRVLKPNGEPLLMVAPVSRGHTSRRPSCELGRPIQLVAPRMTVPVREAHQETLDSVKALTWGYEG
jgi:ubiquinone/menaquinone biosynthesis C-methylase UbiE